MIFQMCTNFRLAWLGVYMVGSGWVLKWGAAECIEMWYDAEGYVAVQLKMEKMLRCCLK